jgi:hypothetical protein
MPAPFRPRIVWGYPGDLVTLDLRWPQMPWRYAIGGVGGSAVAASGIPEAFRIRKDNIASNELRVEEDELPDFLDFLEWARESGATFTFRFDQDDAGTAHTVYLHSPRWEDSQEVTFERDEFLMLFKVPISIRTEFGTRFTTTWGEY